MISLSGIQITNLELKKDDKGMSKISGNYSLISNTGVTLAKQSFGGSYSDINIPYSAETNDLHAKLSNSITDDVNSALGLGE